MPRHSSEDPDDPTRALGRAATADSEATPSGLDETQPAPPPVSLGLDETAIATHHSAETAETLTPPSIAAGSTVGGKGRDKSRNRATRGSIPVGQHIDRFIVEGELGAGGMGVVYAAFDPKLDRKVAIKMLHESLSGSQRARLEREARAMAKLSHPNVVSVHEVGELDGRLYVAMEFVEGKNLREWLKEDKPDRDAILETMIAAGRGLAAAHKADMVHRDFKPDNILVGKSGRPRVSDFGLVSALDPSDSLIESQERHPDTPVPTSDALTVVGSIMGTPLYMAPEQHRGDIADHKADQFSFCATLWEALFDQPPFSANNYDALVEKVSNGDISLSRRALKSPKWLRKVLLKGLAANPDDRYADMDAVLAALDRSSFRRRRNVAIIASALVLVGGTSYVVASGSNAQKNPCADVAAPMERVWSPAKRRELIESFASTKHDRAKRNADMAVSFLDSYASEWVSNRTRVCEETHADRKHGALYYELSNNCFDEKLVALEAVTDLLRRADSTIVESALQHVSDLDELAMCTDAAALTRSPLPEVPGAAERFSVLSNRYEDIRNMLRRSQHQEALPLLVDLSVDAREFGYAPLSAKVIHQLGSVQNSLGDHEAAEKSYREAAEEAGRAQDDEAIARIWINMLELLTSQARHDEAVALEAVATASAKRVSSNKEIQARLANALGTLYFSRADYERVLEEYTRALELQRQIDPPNPMLAPALANVGLALWYRGDMEGAEKHFVESLELMLEDYGPDHAQVAYARKNIGDLQRNRGDYQAARENYLEVLRVWKLTLGEEHENLAYAYETLAAIATETGDREAGLRYARQTLSIREKHLPENHPLMSQACSVLARSLLAFATPGTLEEAEAVAKRGLAIDLALGDDGKRTLPYTYEQLGLIARRKGNRRDAIYYLEQVVNIRLTTVGESHPHTTMAITNLAMLLDYDGQRAKALDALLQLDEHLESLDAPDPYSTFSTKRQLAGLYTAMNEKDKAEPYMAATEALLGKFASDPELTAEMKFELILARYTLGMKERALSQAKALLKEDLNPYTATGIRDWLAKVE